MPIRAPLARSASWLRSGRVARVAVAAAVVLAAGAAIVYQATQSSVGLLAAELMADHVKCGLINGAVGTAHSEAAVEHWLSSAFGWQADLPDAPEREGLELVGSRTCLYGRGRVAHIMYRDIRHEGKLVSVFMLPGQVREAALVDALGHEASVWSDGRRTFVLLAREPRSEVARLASFVTASLH
jgi:hypothetical protein